MQKQARMWGAVLACFWCVALASIPCLSSSAEKQPGSPTVLRYHNPAYTGTENYGLLVLQKGPEFTEEELRRYCDDVYPVAGRDLNLMLIYMEGCKGWERDRVYYMMAKILYAVGTLAQKRESLEAPAPYGQGMDATPQEQQLVEKYLHSIPAFFGGGRVLDNAQDPSYVAHPEDCIDPALGEEAGNVILESSKPFTEEELRKALKDMARTERLDFWALLEKMQQAGWARNRAFYMLHRVRIGYTCMRNKKVRQHAQQYAPQLMATPEEQKLLKKHEAAVKRVQYVGAP